MTIVTRPASEALEIAFGYGPLDASPVFQDVYGAMADGKNRGREAHVTRARTSELDRFDAGQFSCVLSNRDQKLNPRNSASAWYPNIRPCTPIRYTVNGVVTFYGYTAGFPQTYPSYGYDALVQLSALDALSLVNRRTFTTEPGFSQQASGARFTNVLRTYLGYAASLCDFDAGISTITASASLLGTSPTDHLQEVALAEGGRFFCSKAGLFTFRDAASTIQGLESNLGSFSAGNLDFMLDGDQILNDDSLIYNSVTITGGSGTPEAASDATSISAYGERDYAQTWPLIDSDALSRAQRVLREHKDSTLRIPGLEIIYATNPTAAWAVINALEIGQRYSFAYQPRGGGDPIANDVIVDGIKIDSIPGEYHVTVQLTPADAQRYWLSGIAGFSESGVTTYSF